MADLIIRTFAGDEWLALLSNRRRQNVRRKFNHLRSENVDPPLIEVTDFSDKRDVLAQRGLLGRNRKRAVRDFRRIEGLRNSVAHAATYAQNADQFREFVELLALTEGWIKRLSRYQSRAGAQRTR